MKQQATQMMWFYDRQHAQWSLSDHASYQLWQERGLTPGSGNWRQMTRPALPTFSPGFTTHSNRPSSSVTSARRVARCAMCSGAASTCRPSRCAAAGLHRSTPPAAPSCLPTSPSNCRCCKTLLTQLAQALSARTGLDFFNTLVNQLAHILVADAVWLAERTGGGRLKVLACHGIDLKEYELDGMPCQQVYLAGQACVIPWRTICPPVPVSKGAGLLRPAAV